MTSRSLSHAGRTGSTHTHTYKHAVAQPSTSVRPVVSCRSQVQTYEDDGKRSEQGIAKAACRRDKCNLGKATAPSRESKSEHHSTILNVR